MQNIFTVGYTLKIFQVVIPLVPVHMINFFTCITFSEKCSVLDYMNQNISWLLVDF